MKLTFSLFAFLVFLAPVYSQQSVSPNFFDIQKQSFEYFQTHKSSSLQEQSEYPLLAKYRRWERFWKQRVTPEGKFPNPMIVYNETVKKQANIKNKDASTLTAPPAEWKPRGPFGASVNGGAGRVNRVYINPAFPRDIWVGTTAGGAWKSNDSGRAWKVKTDGIPVYGVTDIATSPIDPNTVYIATGDGDGGSVTPNIQTHNGYSLGVMKSTDGGNTWRTTGLNWESSNAWLISRLVVSPSNPMLLLAATSQGIYKTIDSGATWTLTIAGNFRDMEYKPNDTNTVYAANGSEIYKSRDQGTTWSKLGTGIPLGAGRIALAVSPANPEMVFAVTADKAIWDYAELYTSTNAGKDWQLKANNLNILGKQGWYNLALTVSPTSVQEIYIGGTNVIKSTNGGTSWKYIAHAQDTSIDYIHPNIHDICITKGNPSIVYAATDGGVYRTTKTDTNWIDISKGLEIMEFYRIACSAANTNFIIGGSESNGINKFKDTAWTKILNYDDGMNCLIDPVNSNNVYVGVNNGTIFRSTDGGVKFDTLIGGGGKSSTIWITPFVFDPTNSKIIYSGYIDVWKSNTKKNTIEKLSEFTGNTLNYIAVAPSDPMNIYTGNDEKMYSTTNGGETWKEMILPKFGSITHLAVSPSNPRRIFVTISGYSNKKVFESMYGGDVWTDLSQGLPLIPINCIVAQNFAPDRLYVGTDAGVYYRDKNLTQWVEYSDGLPKVIVNDLVINYAAGKLLAATNGRGVWEGNLIKCAARTMSAAALQDRTSICEGDSVQISAVEEFFTYKWSTGDTTKSIIVNKAGEYSVIGTDLLGCSYASSPVTISIIPVKTPEITGDHGDSTACDGSPITLGVSHDFSGYKIAWSTGETGNFIKVTKPGVYFVTVTNTAGCSRISKDFTVKLGTPPAKPVIYVTKDTLVATLAKGYQWYIDGTKIPGATEKWFVPPTGSIGKKAKVEVFNGTGCSTMSDDFVITVTSVEEEKVEKALLLFPNPAGEIITLDMALETVAPITLEITNTAGVSMQKFEFMPEGLTLTKNISLKEFPIGAYIVTVHSGDKIWIRKITKE
ncbi:MAG: hypothetical protein HYZ54_09560 [Ignavibacteriae bacterium]|nr:hypothetical protein [Ignavibacteriota bacterium]